MEASSPTNGEIRTDPISPARGMLFAGRPQEVNHSLGTSLSEPRDLSVYEICSVILTDTSAAVIVLCQSDCSMSPVYIRYFRNNDRVNRQAT